MTEEQICKNIGIGVKAFNVYKHEHPELKETLKKGKDVAIAEIENALFKRALGSNYEETKVSIRDADGKQVKFTEKSTKYLPPDVAACFILLKNKDKVRGWSVNPQKMELEKLMFEFHKKSRRLKFLAMIIRDIKIADIKPYKNNPRNNDAAVKAVAK